MLFALTLLSALLALPYQVEPLSPARQRAAERQARREARRTPAPFKDTHLDVRRLGRGEGEGQPVMANEPRFGRDGLPCTSSRDRRARRF